MEIKLKEEYGKDFLTTVKGNIIYKDKWTKFDEEDNELEKLLDTNIFIIKNEEDKKMDEEINQEEFQEEIIEETPEDEVSEDEVSEEIQDEE